MQLTASEALPLLEKSGALAFVDIETSGGLNADYATVTVVCIKPYKGKPITFTSKPGNDKELLKKVREELQKYQCWVTFYGRGFDIPFIQSRLLVNRLPMLEKKHHLDMYYTVKFNTHLSRNNQGHILSFLGTPESKMSVGPSVWSEMASKPKESLKILKERCESDVIGLEAMYERCKHFVRDLNR